VTIGGTKNPDLERIASLRPTHILVNEEENKLEHILACETISPTFRTYPKTPDEVPALLRQVGEWLGRGAEGESWAGQVESRLNRLKELEQRDLSQIRKYLYLIWKEPYMVASDDTYIAGMLKLIGLSNIAPLNTRYPSLSVREMRELSPDVIFLSSEPYPFRNRDIKVLEIQWMDRESIAEDLHGRLPHFRKIDGQVLSWYGTMTVSGLDYLDRLRRELVSLRD
jgi:ABC-type Fe3+-hydroxamate transport system substrate-binding protein